ncbi:replication initiation protein [Persicobacter diffluens]|uniref:Initiator Rep protein WH1 domain-containing protein n=1 Tax=Persicobacter diffluens TaxID=981 RepID=A0AAN4W3P6_9BACT|nr:hypothetical protein PEDI_51040 [Persicobacter diffluens]
MAEVNLEYSIVKSNRLVESRNHFSVVQQRILAVAFSLLQPDQEKFEWIEIPVKSLFTGKIGKSQYNLVKKAVSEMTELTVYVTGDNGYWRKVSLLEASGYDADRTVKVRFIENARDLLMGFSGEYTKYLLGNVWSFDSSYSFNVYELCKQYQKVGKRTVSIIFLRERLGLIKHKPGTRGNSMMLSEEELMKMDTKYPAFKDFEKYVLQAAQRDINTQSDLHIAYEKHKKGRSIVSLTFEIKANPKYQRPKIESLPKGAVREYGHQDEKEVYVDEYIAKQKSVKNKSAYRKKLMNDPEFEDQFQSLQKQKKQAEKAAQQKAGEQELALQIEEWKAEFNQLYKSVRLPYCQMANENSELISEFRSWYQEHGSVTDKRGILERIDAHEMKSSDWLKFGTFMIERIGTEEEKKYFLKANPQAFLEMKRSQWDAQYGVKITPAKPVFNGFDE